MPKESQKEAQKEDAGEKKSSKKSVCVIAKPLAKRRVEKKLLKLVKTAAGKKEVKRGVKDVVKAIKKGEKGICVLAGDISPIDVITHVPIVCEEHGISYIYVSSRESLGLASGTKKPSSAILVSEKVKNSNKDEYEECLSSMKSE
eukprot:CAMPEP_0177663504 /NCGR_PEP_ID=MMETSP0447-20121125/19952_1 /TAXON_ID=0 /ORGANISM="Stygamoeba regulata, Strain BSH-02190019" /LENGTH=144 /DNA_ID=CAMNT_0019169327 /DNA_START=38 /DNA_END=472 /DNA_ORIENTATION=+